MDSDDIIIQSLYLQIIDESFHEDDIDEKEQEKQIHLLKSYVKSILADLATAAISDYESWEQDEEGYSEEYGVGGICDTIAESLVGVFELKKPEALSDWESFTMYTEHNCHTDLYVVNHKIKKIFQLGLDPSYYESGGGYTWKKRDEHSISDESFYLTDTYLDYENFFDEEGNLFE